MHCEPLAFLIRKQGVIHGMSSGSRDVYSHLSNAYGTNHFDLDRPFQTVLTYFTGKVPPLSDM